MIITYQLFKKKLQLKIQISTWETIYEKNCISILIIAKNSWKW